MSAMLFIGGTEIVVILLIVVMLFGADKIPELARGLGQGMRQLRDATEDIKKEIRENADDINPISDIKDDIKEATKDLDDMTGPIKRQR